MKTQRSTRLEDRRRWWGGTTFIVIAIVLAIALVSTAAVFMGSGDGLTARAARQDEYVVERGSFEISVPASGELAALRQIEIRNRLEYRSVITELAEEGTYVTKGDVLVSFAEDEVTDKITDAEDAVNTAEAALVAAQSKLDIRISAGESEIARADLDATLAGLALQAWEEGEVVSKRQELKLEIKTAEMDYSRLFDKFEESKELVKQQYISQDDYRIDEINMIKAKARLDQGQLDAEVYENYEFPQDQAQRQSDVEQASAERVRVEDRLKAELETNRVEVTSKEHQLRSREQRLDDLRKQLELCTIQAPSDGLVVYATSLETHRWSRGDRGDLQVGGEVRKNELLMVLPDTSEMTAEIKVNESLTGLIETGQRVIVTSDAAADVSLEGKVLSIGVLAESGGWRDPNRRDYTVKVLLTGIDGLGLKPSMRCKAEIYVGVVEDAIYVPLQAVYREGTDAFVYVPNSAGYSQRRVDLGKASGLHVEITDGLDQGELVLLREPKAREIVARLEDGPPAEGQAALGRPESDPGAMQGRRSRNRPGRPPHG